MSVRLLLTAITLTAVLAVVPGVSAQVVEQNQNLETRASTNVTCQVTATGAYGQATEFRCEGDADATARGSQSQRVDLGTTQVIVRANGTVVCERFVYRADGTPVCVHIPANTGLDAGMMAAALGTIVTGAGVAITKIRQ